MNSSQIAGWLNSKGWLLNLGFTMMGSYFVAGAANAFVANQVRVIPTVEQMGAAGNDPSRAGGMGVGGDGAMAGAPVDLSRIASRNLMGAMREELNPKADEAGAEGEAGPGPDPNDLRPCTMTAVLRGTLVAEGAPEASLAVIFDTGKGEPRVFSINPGSNQISDDATLVEIRSREIVVRRRDHFERCLGEGEQEGAAQPVAALAPVPGGEGEGGGEPSEGGGAGVRKLSETNYAIDKGEMDRVLGNLNEVATQARIVPSFRNGKSNGFKLFSIKPGSIYAKIGLQNGDVVQKINGYEMSSPDKALEVYQKLKDAGTVSVELTRRGQSMNMSYNIQ